MRESLFDENGKAKNRADLLSVGVLVGPYTRVTKLAESDSATTERRTFEDGHTEVHVTVAPVDLRGDG